MRRHRRAKVEEEGEDAEEETGGVERPEILNLEMTSSKTEWI